MPVGVSQLFFLLLGQGECVKSVIHLVGFGIDWPCKAFGINLIWFVNEFCLGRHGVSHFLEASCSLIRY
jgi:hypothetical protein